MQDPTVTGLPPAQSSVAILLLFFVVSFCVWLFVSLFHYQRDKSWIAKDIVTKFSGHHPMVEREAKFENGYMGVRSC